MNHSQVAWRLHLDGRRKTHWNMSRALWIIDNRAKFRRSARTWPILLLRGAQTPAPPQNLS